MKRRELNQPNFNVLDLFAGCGGMSNGFEQAGFRIIAANDIWIDAKNTYIRNHPHTEFILGDITDKNIRDIILNIFKETRCDVIIGGPPCQAYSMSGARNVDDPRGFLFEDYVKIVQALHPRIFVIENVSGILTMEHDKESLTINETRALSDFKDLEKERSALILKRKQSKNTSRIMFTPAEAERLEDLKRDLKCKSVMISILREKITNKIVKRFKEIGYSVKFKLLNAADYGVPQKRERVIFIGTPSQVDINFPPPTHSQAGIGHQNDLFAKPKKQWITVKDAIDDLKNIPENALINHVFVEHSPDFVKKILNTPIGASVFGGYSDAFYKNPPNEPSRTVKENHGGVLVHYEKPRVMTPRELARLQSFPDDFIFEGRKSSVLKQIGNAVPPLLAKAIAMAVMDALLNERKTKGLTSTVVMV